MAWRPLLCVCWLLVGLSVSPLSASAAGEAGTGVGPPRPGTTDSGLTESEEATLWSNLPAGYWDDNELDTAIGEVSTETDLTFSDPPTTAIRWTRYAHEQYQAGGVERSVHPSTATTSSSQFIQSAHATAFSVTPSTRTHVEPDDTRFYVAPEGQFRGTVDYRVETPEGFESGGWSYSYRITDHDIESIRLYADDERIATVAGTHRPTIDYELPPDADHLRLEADIEATVRETIRPPPDSEQSTRTRLRRDSITVSDTVAVDVYEFRASVVRARYPDGHTGLAVTQSVPWRGYTMDEAGTETVRGIWRFFTARDTEWDRLVATTNEGTRTLDSHALPVYVHAYPSRMRPRAKPEYGEPTILRTWGPTNDPPTDSLPEHAAPELVEGPYNATHGIAVRTDVGGVESLSVHGIVRGTEAAIQQFLSEPQSIRESNLSVTRLETDEGTATVRIELTDAATGEPIELVEPDPSDDPFADTQTGHIEFAGRTLRTDERGRVTVGLTEPGVYTARYRPASWLDSSPAYAADTATIRWHPLTTPAGWVRLFVRAALLAMPFWLTVYAARRFGAFLHPERGGRP